jgi:hypothetical protein
MPTNRKVSQETTPLRRVRRPQAPPSLVQELDQVFTQRPRVARLTLLVAPSTGRAMPEGATANPPERI